MTEASCHCGAVRITVRRRPSVVPECTCSICRRYGAMWAHYSRRSVTVECEADGLGRYVRGDGLIAFCHCRRCGCLTHSESTDPSPTARVSINARMMDPAIIEKCHVRLFDVADTWTYIR